MSKKKLPEKIYVTYVGKDAGLNHKGRSAWARKNPYRLVYGVSVEVTEPDDVEFFVNRKKQDFIITTTPIPPRELDKFISEHRKKYAQYLNEKKLEALEQLNAQEEKKRRRKRKPKKAQADSEPTLSEIAEAEKKKAKAGESEGEGENGEKPVEVV